MTTGKSNWKGYDRYDFEVSGREAIVVCPKRASPGNPWIWRAEFFDAFAQADMALLEQGYHLAYYMVSDMYGCPEAIELMHGFQEKAEEEFNLSAKTVLFGFSRGGLYSVNYAATYPDRVAALYLDAPVLDLGSWPGGKGKKTESASEWAECLRCYGMTDEQFVHFKGNPLDRAEELAEFGIPIILVAGDADDLVPYADNGEILASRYREHGGVIEVILKPGIGHHPHSLEDPSPIVDFILKHSK
ncbi:alpha/beta fold hydrolase [Cohnella lupini]|uniref:Prolyl oligopeptidase family protein n=1 Tax=Cohnella lupini TaxID=1294267 RepID=A0A3D9ISY7_9BACL|nr:alpha/beta hydrolase [Cohnella lupini]RED64795.1 prolyl oligopeptidase family protein [Cohnella lupini]